MIPFDQFEHFLHTICSCTNTRIHFGSIRSPGRRPRATTVHYGPIKSTSGNKMDGWRTTTPGCCFKNSCFTRRYVFFCVWWCDVMVYEYWNCRRHGWGTKGAVLVRGMSSSRVGRSVGLSTNGHFKLGGVGEDVGFYRMGRAVAGGISMCALVCGKVGVGVALATAPSQNYKLGKATSFSNARTNGFSGCRRRPRCRRPPTTSAPAQELEHPFLSCILFAPSNREAL